MKFTIRNPTPPAKVTLAHREPGGKASSGASYFFLGNATSNIARPGPQNIPRVERIDCWPPYPMSSTALIRFSSLVLPLTE